MKDLLDIDWDEYTKSEGYKMREAMRTHFEDKGYQCDDGMYRSHGGLYSSDYFLPNTPYTFFICKGVNNFSILLSVQREDPSFTNTYIKISNTGVVEHTKTKFSEEMEKYPEIKKLVEELQWFLTPNSLKFIKGKK